MWLSKTSKYNLYVSQGEDLNLGVPSEDVEVTIGKEKCKVTSLSQTQLTCLPPEKEPTGDSVEIPPLLTVSTFVGINYAVRSLSPPLCHPSSWAILILRIHVLHPFVTTEAITEILIFK